MQALNSIPLLAVVSLLMSLQPLLSSQDHLQTQTESAPPSTATQQPAPAPQPPERESQTATQTGESTAKNGTKPSATAKKKKRKKSAKTGPRRVVVRNGSTEATGGQLEPGFSRVNEADQRQTIAKLQQLTDGNLKSISSRKLTSDQQDVVRQISFFMEQSRQATQDGDLVRAHNLALKAHLLSDELVRQ